MYGETLTKEIETLIKDCNFDCTVEDFKDKVDWHWISKFRCISEEFVREFQNSLDWQSFNNNLQSIYNFSEDFIREFKDKLDWDKLSDRGVKLSEEFIREFQNKVDWYLISKWQILSEEFIRMQKLAGIQPVINEENTLVLEGIKSYTNMFLSKSLTNILSPALKKSWYVYSNCLSSGKSSPLNVNDCSSYNTWLLFNNCILTV